jgi:Cu(I)/Ag(I) efflux system membrane fusion protein
MSENSKKKNRAVMAAAIAVALCAVGALVFFKAAENPAGHAAEGGDGGAQGAAIAVKDGAVTLSARARQAAGVQTARAAVRNISRNLRTTGKVAMDENRRSYITSRVEGRLDVLYVASEGEFIQAGQMIGEVYSPAYIAAQEEFLLALRSRRRLQGAGEAAGDGDFLEAARRKLLLLNVAEKDIRELQEGGRSKNLMPVYAQFSGIVLERQALPGGYIKPGDRLFSLIDLSTVWINADIYEKDLALVRVGAEALITSQAYPGETFRGQVVFVNPILDDATRTVKARVALDNRGGRLKPNMFVSAAIRVPLGESLVVPESAVLDYGEGQAVFVAQEENTFARREVLAGHYANGYVQILSGLQAGEHVVSAAAFLLDSQTKLGGFSGHGGHGGGSGGGAHN